MKAIIFSLYRHPLIASLTELDGLPGGQGLNIALIKVYFKLKNMIKIR